MATSRRTQVENVSTYGNNTRDYDGTAGGLASWEGATDIDLNIAGKGEALECYDDAASYDDTRSMSGATNTSSTQFRVIRTAAGQGHDGTQNNGFTIADTSGSVMRTGEENFHVYDLILTSIADSTTSAETTVKGANISTVVLVGLIIHDSTNIGTGSIAGIIQMTGTCINCLVHNMEGDGYDVESNAFMYNCVATDNGLLGFEDSGVGQTLKNCLSTGNGTADYDAFADGTMEDCASEDASASGTRPHASITMSGLFVDEAGNDFHLQSGGDANVVDNGQDLSADGSFAFDDDIDTVTITTWSIGFDSIVAAPGGGPPLYHPIAPYRHNLVR